MKKHLHVIQSIVPGSIAEEMELQPGDTVLAINGQDIEDVFDYHYLVNDEYIEMLIRTADGTEEVLEIEKDYDEDIGIVFESSLMDDYRSCSNNCIFCFIDQLPKGMRETMYFKDDDSRLSFLQGNYITMTNMKDEALERIIRYKLEPINVSVHTTNPELRCMMLHNRFAGKIMEQLQKLYEGGIIMNRDCLCDKYSRAECAGQKTPECFLYIHMCTFLILKCWGGGRDSVDQAIYTCHEISGFCIRFENSEVPEVHAFAKSV